MNNNLFEISQLRCSYDKNYREGNSKVVLEIHNLQIPQGKTIFIVGESGIGKSTILETLGLMNDTIVRDPNTRFVFCGAGEPVDLVRLWETHDDEALSRFRLKHYNFIFQSTNLMRNFTAYENIMFTRMLQGYSRSECLERAKKVMEELGLEHINESRMAQELSGGQQQRLAFARAVLPDFTVLFGDEPTGNLDGDNAVRVMRILANKLHALSNASAIIVSHDMHLATQFADIIIKIRRTVRPKRIEQDEDVVYGVIDEKCVYQPLNGTDNGVWSNSIDTYDVCEFESFLRKRDK